MALIRIDWAAYGCKTDIEGKTVEGAILAAESALRCMDWPDARNIRLRLGRDADILNERNETVGMVLEGEPR